MTDALNLQLVNEGLLCSIYWHTIKYFGVGRLQNTGI